MYYGDCVVLCDYVALKLNIQLMLVTINHLCMSLCLYHCRKGHLEVVKLLLMNSKLDVNNKDDSGQTPLHLACR